MIYKVTRYKHAYGYRSKLFRWLVWGNEHITEFLQFLRTSYFFRQEGQADDVEELVV